MFAAEDTIVAISSAAGLGVRAIVRLSGREAVALADRVLVWSQRPVGEAPGFQSMPVIVRLGAEASELPARVYVFRAPRSYTREDVVELHVPGAASVASALEASLAEAGARRAEPGEFTARALLSGRIDLSAAEAVADVVNAADEAQLRSAVSALGGTVHRFCGRASQELTEILACVEASIDLADEDVTLDHPNPLAALLDGWSARLRRIADEAADLPDAAEQPRAVLAGRTNVGKSSLLNALTGTPRAIVSALAGTTRDVLSASMTVGGAGLTVQDAAGFAGPAGPLAATAHSAARSAVAAADLILLVVDVTAGAFGPDAAVLQEVRRSNPSAPVLLLANKADLIGASPPPMGVVALSREANARVLLTSAVTARGLEQVKQALAACLHLEASRSGQALGLHRRQKRCLLSAGEGTARAAELLQSAGEIVDVAELAAVELRSALRELGRISGEVVTEDVLAAIFARFCVGK